MYITKKNTNETGHKFIKDGKIYEIKEDNTFVATDEYNRTYTMDFKIIRKMK